MSDFLDWPDLASRALGGGVIYANDEFFAAADNLVSPEPPAFSPRTFGAKGQVYDGWETRRRRDPGHDFAIVRLGVRGVIHGVVVDTAFFTGNYPPYASVEACRVEGVPDLSTMEWRTIAARTPLTGDSRHLLRVHDSNVYTHVRLSIYPDGGVARLRVHGEARPDPVLLPIGMIDLAAAEHGGVVLDCSDKFYGSPQNLLLPGLARVMGEGWETRRRRDEGNDWVQVRLGLPGVVHLVELDTSHFKGNAPGWAALRGRVGSDWIELLPRVQLQPDTRQRFRVTAAEAVSQVRLDIFPDGGMARLRLFGAPS